LLWTQESNSWEREAIIKHIKQPRPSLVRNEQAVACNRVVLRIYLF
jgi:hypothetical protein